MFHSCKDFHGGGYYQSVTIFNILNEKNMKYFEVGQTGYDVIHGKGEVISTNDSTNYPIRVQFEKSVQIYCNDGRFDLNYPNASLFQTAPIITPNVPIVEFNQGELVLVKDSDEWLLRYFSHFENEEYCCFSNQRTEGNTFSWKEIRKLNDNPLLTT